MAKKEARLFLGVWGDGYLCCYKGNANVKEVEIDFFCEERCYSDSNIEKIRNLGIGECAKLSDPSGHHSIVRIR